MTSSGSRGRTKNKRDVDVKGVNERRRGPFLNGKRWCTNLHSLSLQTDDEVMSLGMPEEYSGKDSRKIRIAGLLRNFQIQSIRQISRFIEAPQPRKSNCVK